MQAKQVTARYAIMRKETISTEIAVPEYDISRAFEIIAERKIVEAIEEGKFDDLPGKGEPLKIDPQWLVPPHLRVAATILHNAQILPEWAQADREIVQSREAVIALRRRMQIEYPLRQSSPVFTNWYRNILQSLWRLMHRVNGLILQYNISAPHSLQVYAPFHLVRELNQILAQFPPPESLDIEEVLREAKESSEAVRTEARARYESMKQPREEAP